MKIDSKNFKFSSIILTIGIFSASFSTFFQNVVLSRILSKTDFSLLMKVLGIIGFFVIIAEFGLTQFCTVKFSNFYVNKNKGILKFIKKVLLTSLLYSGLLTIILIFIKQPLCAKYKINFLQTAILLGSSWIIILSLNKILLAFSIGQKMNLHSFIIYISIEPLKLTSLLIILFYYKIKNPLTIFKFLNYSVWLGFFLVIIFFILTFFKKNKIKKFTNNWVKNNNTNLDNITIFPENINYYVSFLTKYLTPHIAVLIPGIYLEDNTLPLLLICLPLLNIFDLFFQGINLSLLSHLSSKKSDLKCSIKKIKKISLYLIGAAILIFIILQFSKSRLILLLYGHKYHDSIFFFSVLLCASLLDSFKNISDPLLYTQGFSKHVMCADLAKIVLLSIGFFILIPIFNIKGFLISYIVAYFSSTFMKNYFLYKKIKIDFKYHIMALFIISISTLIFLIN